MAQLDGKWVQNDTLNQTKIRLQNNTPLRGRNAGDTADVNILKVNASDLPEFDTQPQFNGSPNTDNDLVNRGYVLSAVQGIRDPKDAVRVASTGNIDIATSLINGTNIDGVVVATGDRVLLKNQSTASQNGIYVVVAAGAASRSTDANEDAEVTQGMSVMVAEGTLNARRIYVLTTADPITVDTTALSFAQAPNPANFLVPKVLKYSIAAGADLVSILLPHAAEDESIVVTPVGGVQQEYNTDFTVGLNGGVTELTWAGNMAATLALGDVVQIYYSYEA
jgi:hypothetical protein